ncbi:MAG TPA: hypothetical protein VHQ47_08490 [Phycisphaerae bacterium]|nr:hypothetical protein [Phycisphaerae bacterium]
MSGEETDQRTTTADHADGGLALAEAFTDDDAPLAGSGGAGEAPDETSEAIETLDDIQRRRRVLFVRAAIGVPVAAIIAIGGALLLHMLVAGGLLAALFFGWGQSHGGGDQGDNRAGGGGYVVMDTGPAGAPQVGGAADAARALQPTKPPAPTLPELHEPSADPLAVARAELTPPPDPGIIGLSGAADLGALKSPTRPEPAPPIPQPAAPTLTVAPPPDTPVHVVASAHPVVARGAKAGSPLAGAGNGGAAQDDEGDDPTISIMGPAYKGVDLGKGGRRGNGIDRGPSGANNPDPQVLEQPPLAIPSMTALDIPKQAASFTVEVLASGKAGKITLNQSCGNAYVDEMCRTSILETKFRPAYEGGVAVTRELTMSFEFGPGESGGAAGGGASGGGGGAGGRKGRGG